MDVRLFLRDEELDRGVALLLAAEKALVAAGASAITKSGLNRGGIDLLLGIRARPGISVSDLRAQLDMTVPTFARILGQADKAGYIRKRRAGRDARTRALELTEVGHAAITPIADALREALRTAYREAGAEPVSGMRVVLEALLERSDG